MKNKKITLFSIMLLLCFTIFGSSMQNNNTVFAQQNFDLSAKSAVLMDYNSGTVIYEKDKDKKLPIASMVKLMTIYLTFKNIEDKVISYDQIITSSEKASGMGGSQVFIDPYAMYKVEDLLKSVIMASANDASVALAETISGSEESFVDSMNKTAKELGMKNTLYCNCTGLPAPEQYSTAEDCAIILKEVLNFEDYHKFSNVWMDELIHESGRKTELVNTNKMIRYYEGCDGGKTGSTSEAGYCLSASAKRNNLRLISVVIGAKTGKDRFKESTTLLNFGFSNYENKQLINKEVVLKEISTKKCKNDIANIIATEDFYAFDKKGVQSEYEVSLDLPEKISKTKSGEIIGHAIISKDGVIIKKIPLTVKEDLIGMSIKDNFIDIIKNW